MIESHPTRALRRHSRRPEARRVARLAPVLAAALGVLIAGAIDSAHYLAAVQGPGSAVPSGEVRALAPGEVVRRRMEAGATHAFELAMSPGQFAQVVVEQRGADVGVRLTAPGGSVLIEMDSPNGFYGRETVSVVAQDAGNYRLEVYSDKTLPSGDYELRVEGPRASAAADERRVTAERVFTEAQRLRGEAGSAAGAEAGGKYDAAIRKYNESLGAWRELGDLRGQGYSLSGIGRSYKARGQLSPALEHLGQAREQLREAGDLSGQAFVLNETGAAHRDLGDLRDALACYEEALRLRAGLGDLWGQAQLHNNVGLIYSYIGYQPKAAESHEKALPIWRELGQRSWEMNTLINAAKARVEMGDLNKALERYQEVLAFCDAELGKADSPLKPSAVFLRPYALNGLGLVYDTWADPEAARDHYRQALELFRANKYGRGEADVLDNLGMTYAFLGDATQALEYFTEALGIRERLNEPRGWAGTLSNVGYAHTLLGQDEEALKHLALALPMSERTRDRRFEAYTLVRMGTVYASLAKWREALESYERALAIQQEEAFADSRGQAITLDKMGEARARLGEWAEALKIYGRALERWKAVGDEQGRALTLYGIAWVESKQQNLANARDRIEEAMNVVEKLRHRVSGRQLRMTYFAGKQDLYALDIAVRMRLYERAESPADKEANLEAALSASERARARNLLDLLSEARTAPHKGLSPQDAEKNSRLEREISALAQAQLRLRGLGDKEGAAVVEREYDRRIREQDKLQAPARSPGTFSAAAGGARPLSAREIRRLLDDDTLLLQYSLGDERSHLWAVTRTGIEHHFLAGRAELERVAEQLRKALTAYEPRAPGESAVQYVARLREAADLYGRSGLELSRLVLGPVSSRLGHKRLVIVADGALQYVPFEALPITGEAGSFEPASDAAHARALILQNEVVYQPSASALARLREARPRGVSKTVAVLADPVFDDKDERVRSRVGGRGTASPRRASVEQLTRSLRDIGDIGDVGDGDFSLPKLEYSLAEANAITAVAPRGSWMKAVGFKANRATAMSPALKQFGIVHFATHGILNDKHPELSGIVLSMVNERGEPEDGYLTLRDIYNLDLPVDLVVLSACRTGIGKQVRGEGLLGLTRGFMYAGAPRVVASLWRVDDEASAELMRRFYLHMLGKNKVPASAALRKAKLEMRRAGGAWSAPYYWAGFVLQGDWQ